MKHLARHMRRAGVAPKRNKKQERGEASTRFTPLITPQIEIDLPPQPEGLTEIPDAWDPKYRPETQRAAAEARKELAARAAAEAAEEATEDADGYTTVSRKRVSRKKRRVLTMGIAVSEEEEAIIRAHVAKMDSSFSAWAREVIFRAIGRRLPARPKRG